MRQKTVPDKLINRRLSDMRVGESAHIGDQPIHADSRNRLYFNGDQYLWDPEPDMRDPYIIVTRSKGGYEVDLSHSRQRHFDRDTYFDRWLVHKIAITSITGLKEVR